MACRASRVERRVDAEQVDAAVRQPLELVKTVSTLHHPYIHNRRRRAAAHDGRGWCRRRAASGLGLANLAGGGLRAGTSGWCVFAGHARSIHARVSGVKGGDGQQPGCERIIERELGELTFSPGGTRGH